MQRISRQGCGEQADRGVEMEVPFMTVAATPTETWQGLDWRKMQANVFRLQKRIY